MYTEIKTSNSFLKLISPKCSSFWFTTYLLNFIVAFFNRQSEFLWVAAVFFSLTCFFFHTGLLMKYETNLSRSYDEQFMIPKGYSETVNQWTTVNAKIIHKKITQKINDWATQTPWKVNKLSQWEMTLNVNKLYNI
jgi:hypothetical protein